MDGDPDRIDSISPHPRWLAKSAESPENKRVEFSVDAKNDKRVGKQQEVKEIDDVKEWRVWHRGVLAMPFAHDAEGKLSSKNHHSSYHGL